MVCWGLSWNGVIALHFYMPGVKTTTKIYEETVLELVLRLLNDKFFNGQY